MTDNLYQSPNSNIEIDSQEIRQLTLKQILFSFRGRITRSTYWFSFLGIVLMMIALMLLVSAIGLDESIVNGFFFMIYGIFIWSSIAVQVKRWHDRDKSGSWVLISFVPLIGPFWALIENGFLSGTAGTNRFGPPSV